jgi:hypothetical protein
MPRSVTGPATPCRVSNQLIIRVVGPKKTTPNSHKHHCPHGERDLAGAGDRTW